MPGPGEDPSQALLPRPRPADRPVYRQPGLLGGEPGLGQDRLGGGDRLDTSGTPAMTHRTAVADRYVAQLAGHSVGAGDQGTVDEQPATDAGTDGHQRERPGTHAVTEPVLRHGQRLDVVLQGHRQPGRPRQQLAQRYVVPPQER